MRCALIASLQVFIWLLWQRAQIIWSFNGYLKIFRRENRLKSMPVQNRHMFLPSKHFPRKNTAWKIAVCWCVNPAFTYELFQQLDHTNRLSIAKHTYTPTPKCIELCWYVLQNLEKVSNEDHLSVFSGLFEAFNFSIGNPCMLSNVKSQWKKSYRT